MSHAGFRYAGRVNRDEIQLYIERLATRLAERDVAGEIAIFGGAAMVLAYRARVSTRDVDAVFEPKAAVTAAAEEVTREDGAPEGWLNDAVKGFLAAAAETRILFDLPNLRVFVATPEYLLAMKCMSMRLGRDETDLRDIRFLMRTLGLRDAPSVLALVERYYPSDRIAPKTRFAIEELCQQPGTAP